MKIISYIKKVPIVLNIAMIIALVSIVVIDFYLRNIPEIFYWGSDIKKHKHI